MKEFGLIPSHANQGWAALKSFRYRPRAMQLKPRATFGSFSTKKGYARTMETPIRCRMPKTIISPGTKSQVTKVMAMPYEKILNPRHRYFRKSPCPGERDATALL